MSGKIAHKKNVGQMMGQISYRQAKKPWNSRLFLLYLDAPYMDLERIFILIVIKNIEI